MVRRTHQHLDTDALSAFLDERLDGEQREEAAGHIAICPDCRRELRELRATVDLLRGLPQYRPRRSFVLGNEYAHPVRTSRLVRFLPLLPVLRAATVAALLLLFGVGAADVLTEVGNDSNSGNSNLTAQSRDASGETALLPAPNETIEVGDGTGAGRSVAASNAGTKPTQPSSSSGAEFGGAAETSSDQPPDAAAPDEDAEFNAESASESGSVSNAETGSDEEIPSEGVAESAAPPESAGFGESESAEPALAAAAPPETEDEDDSIAADAAADSFSADSSGGQEANGSTSGAMTGGEVSAPTAAATEKPRPTATLAVAPTESVNQPTAAMAGSGSATAQNASGGADSGFSTWRLIEFTLAAAFVLLGALVLSLQRLASRARKIGLVR